MVCGTGRPPAGEKHIKPVTFMLLDKLTMTYSGPGFSGCYVNGMGWVDHSLPTEPDLSRELLLAYRPTGGTRFDPLSEIDDIVEWLVEAYFDQVATPLQGPYIWRDHYYRLGNAKYHKLQTAVAAAQPLALTKHKRRAGEAGIARTTKRRRCV